MTQQDEDHPKIHLTNSEIDQWDSIFLAHCMPVIDQLRLNGLSSEQIAGIINQIRSAAIAEEYYRIQRIISNATPVKRSDVELQSALAHNTKNQKDKLEWCY